MGWWWSTPDPVTFRYPHAIVNGNVSDEAMTLLGRGDEREAWARSGVLRDTDPPVSVFHFATRLGLSDRQLRVIAHEASHVTAQLLGIEDRTHDAEAVIT